MLEAGSSNDACEMSACAGSNAHNFAVSPDGQRFLIALMDDSSTEPPITFVANWTAALK